MRNLRYYSISLAIHGVGFAAVLCVANLGGFTPPQFSLVQGSGGSGGNGGDGNDVPTIEGEVLSATYVAEVRLNPLAAKQELEPRQTDLADSERLFRADINVKEVAKEVKPAEMEPPHLLSPPPTSHGPAGVAADVADVPGEPPLSHRAVADVDVGQLMKASTGPNLHDAPFQRPTNPGAAGSPGGGSDAGEMPISSVANVRPAYPPDALARGIEGKVVLRVVVGQDGSVRSAAVETSSGDASLDASALTTVRDRWRFEPARHFGVPVEMEVRVPISFRLGR